MDSQAEKSEDSWSSSQMSTLLDILHIPRANINNHLDDKLVDLGVDSLGISLLQGWLSPKPSLLVLYNSTARSVLKLLQSSAQEVNIGKEYGSRALSSIDQKQLPTAFPLMEMQESYYIGRFESGKSSPCQVYSEFDFDNLDILAFRKALLHVVTTHPMLRACVKEGHLQEVIDLSLFLDSVNIPISESLDLDSRRAECMNAFKTHPNCFWKIEGTLLPSGGIRLHILIDMIFLDASSAFIVCQEIISAYNKLARGEVDPTDTSTALPHLSFQTYCELLRSKQESDASYEYWMKKIESMPGPPQLPRAQTLAVNAEFPIKRRALRLNHEVWDRLKSTAGMLGVTPTALLLGAFFDVLRQFSHDPSFTLTITISDRLIEGQNFSNVVGEFTNVILCSIVDTNQESLQNIIKQIHEELMKARDHQDMSGLKVMRLLREKLRSPNYTLPIVFTSLLGLAMPIGTFESTRSTLVYQQTQTPEVWLDHQVYEIKTEHGEAELVLNWDYDTKFYSTALIEDMMSSCENILNCLAADPCTWRIEETFATLPHNVARLRLATNITDKFVGKQHLLHMLLDASKSPSKIAIIDQQFSLTYAQLECMIHSLAGLLQHAGVKPGEIVAVNMLKGWKQIVSVFAILSTGATYLPLNPSDPDVRLSAIIARADCLVLTQKEAVVNRYWMPENQKVIEVSESLLMSNGHLFSFVSVSPDSLAYIIFTSGTEGAPKGVEITHRSAVNTCLDINSRFGVSDNDVVFAISSLSFDLSVWDIFGMLAAGGTIVVCKPEGTRDPKYWWEQLQTHRITVWNTVPTSFLMLMETRPSDVENLPLKMVFLSGDAIRIEFIRTVKQANPLTRIVCLGGATEAAIWSNYHEIILCQSPRADLVPYGVPLANQTMHVLDSRGRYRPTGVPGAIYIGGIGVARGYFKDATKTAEKFSVHPQFGRLYNTGDIGRYLPNGEIQIIGRRDAQVKVGGHRVELAEIELCVEKLPSVKRAAVILSRILPNVLVGFAEVTDVNHAENIESDIRDHVANHLPDYMAPRRWIFLSNLPLTSNGKIDNKQLQEPTAPGLFSETSTTDNELKKTIFRCARDIMGDNNHVLASNTSLVEFGMTSLDAIRFSKQLANELGQELPYTLVFNYPTVELIANMISEQSKHETSVHRSTGDAVQAAYAVSAAADIAVIGMSCRLPGGITNSDEFWEMLENGTNCVTDVPKTRFSMDGLYSPNKQVGKSYTTQGAFMTDVEYFDNEFFNISLAEARSMDPQQRLLLEVAYEAFHNAGYNKVNLLNTDTGVFVGQMNYDWMQLSDSARLYAGTGISPSITANRISFVFGLHGPSVTVDTACSSSLVAVDFAVEKLRLQKCSQALVAGVNVILHPEPYLITCAAGMLSPDGRCATFDSNANGIVRGEGIGCVVLKRLDDALANGDTILALIKGTAVNQDGRSATLTAPNGKAQELTIHNALRDAGVHGKDIDYVECHGTGTNLGDPIEVEALSNVLKEGRQESVYLGSVKSNFGHLEGAAGIVGLIKAILVLQHEAVPPNLHFHTLNPKINLSSFKAIVPVKKASLRTLRTKAGSKRKTKLLAGVSSFGFGGTNAHVILQSWTAPRCQSTNKEIVWLFSGQGVQFSGMGRDLYNKDDIFRDAFDECAEYLKAFIDIPLHSLVFDEALKLHLDETRYSQPAILSFEYAASKMWYSRGVHPTVVLGHSIGEYAAAVTCGVMDIRVALRLVCKRAQLMEELCEPGAMAAVAASSVLIMHTIGEMSEVSVASVNGPTSTVISGRREAVQDLLESLGAGHKMLSVNRAFHSQLMKPMITPFQKEFDQIQLNKPDSKILFVSTLTGVIENELLTNTQYWLRQVTEPVNFMAAVLAIPSSGAPITYIELGPRDILTPLARRISDRNRHQWLSSNGNGPQTTEVKQFKQPPHRFDRKYIPWKIPSDQSKVNVVYTESDTNIFYEMQWTRISLESAVTNSGQDCDQQHSPKCKNSSSTVTKSTMINALQMESLCGSECLLLSHKPVSTAGTRWTNVVHVTGNASSDHNIKHNGIKRADLLSTMKEVLAEKAWDSVIMIASDNDSIVNIELGASLMKVLFHDIGFAGQVWFLADFAPTDSYTQYNPACAGLWALIRSAHTELPEAKVLCVESHQITSASEISALCRFVNLQRQSGDILYRVDRSLNQLHVPRLTRLQVKTPSPGTVESTGVISSNATYVITGGVGGIGLVVASWLVDSGANHIVLLSRSMANEESPELVKLRKRSTAAITWIQCDVSSLDNVKEAGKILADMRWPVVKGVFHTAGVVNDAMIKSLDVATCRMSFGPKVVGAVNIRAVFNQTDFLILFSSAGSLIGFAGQASYMAANAAMDALAENWANMGEKVLSIQWAVWSQVGMAKRSNAVHHIEHQGLGSITNQDGIGIIQRLLSASKFGVVCATPILWSNLKTDSKILENIRVQQSPTLSSTDLRSGAFTEAEIVSKVLEMTHEVLGTKLSDTEPLMEAGMTSLDLVTLHQYLVSKYSCVKFTSSVLFNYPTIRDLASYIHAELVSTSTRLQKEARIDASVLKWEKLNNESSGQFIFLIGGALGTASGTFKKLAQLLPSPVFATIPDLTPESASVTSIANELLQSVRKIQPSGKYVFGGLSFGAIVAMEMACQLENDEEYSMVDCLLLFDPRHTPPFVTPTDPAKFELLVALYEPRNVTYSRTVLLRAAMPDFAALSPLLKEAARSFQSDKLVEENMRKWCPALQIVDCSGHHFKFMNMNHAEVAENILNLPLSWKIHSDTESAENCDPIAIISMSCRLPGGVSSPSEFWDMLQRGSDCVSNVPMSRFDMDDVYCPEIGVIGKTYTKRAGFMQNVEMFDHETFGISHSEAKSMDPQQRLLLEAAYDTFHSAGYDFQKLKGCNAGIFVGQANYDWMTTQIGDCMSPYYGVGSSAAITSNRISYVLGLNGPSMTIDTACSSSLVALDFAVEKLKANKCSMALVGGVNVILNKNFFVTASATQALSAAGRCATFDESADGYCRGEGVGCVLLKRLSAAQRDGDNIMAVIKGTYVNHDGCSSSLTAPNGFAQEKVLTAALKEAGFSGKDVDFVECHGTGTKLGDPIEIEALKNVLSVGRTKPVVLGCVKTNIGHLEGAAGVVGVIKAVLVLQHREVPPNVHFKCLNANIDLSGFNAIIPKECINMQTSMRNQSSKPMIAGISSFGFGGTNVHVVLEGSPKYEAQRPIRSYEFKRKFLPWYSLTHPLVYRRESDTAFVAELSGERAELWLDHQIGGRVLLPAASHLTMIAGSAFELNRNNACLSTHCEMNDVIMVRPIIFAANMKIHCELKDGGAQIFTESNTDAPVHAQKVGFVVPGLVPASELQAAQERCTQTMNVAEIYDRLLLLGANFGPKFRNLLEIWQGVNEAVARIGLSTIASWERSLRVIHPALLDSAFQLVGICALNTTGICVPFHVDRAVISTMNEQEELWVHAQLTGIHAGSITGNITITTSSGVTVALAEGITCRRPGIDVCAIECLYGMEWVDIATPPTTNSTCNLSADKGERTCATSDGCILEQSSSALECTQAKVIISFTPVDVTGTDWINIYHCANASGYLFTGYEKGQSIRMDVRRDLAPYISETSIGTVVLIAASNDDAVHVTQVSLVILQAYKPSKSQGSCTEIWFISVSTEQSSTASDCPGACLWAISRTARLEIPDIRLFYVRCPTCDNARSLIGMKSTITSVTERVGKDILFRPGQDLRVSRLVRLWPNSDTSQEDGPLVSNQFSYVISGGFGAIGIVVTKWLVNAGAKYIILLSRTKRNCLPVEIQELQELKSVNIQAIQCDVCVKTEVLRTNEQIKAMRWPPVGGVFHAAGVLFDGTIQNLTANSVERCFKPKVDGAMNLHDILAPSEFLVLFSSASSIFGSVGQCNYAAANAAMDAMACRWSAEGERVLSIQWGAWSEAGMAVEKGALRRAERYGFGLVTNDLGQQILSHLLKAKMYGTVCATPIDWTRMSDPSSSYGPFENEAIKRTPSTLNNVSSATPESLKTAIAKVVIELLGTDVADDMSLIEAGLDSLGAIEFRNLLSVELNIQLPSIFVYNYPSMLTMLRYFTEEHMQVSQSVLPNQQMGGDEAIAIIGMSCRFPGGMTSVDEFWNLLKLGKDCVSDIPMSRFDVDDLYREDRGAIGKMYTKRGAFMDEVEWFDNACFGISHPEAETMDPQQRLLLEVANEAFVDAGYDKLRLKGSDTGVFIGQANYDWLSKGEHNTASPYFGSGATPSITANRLSYTFDLRGPSMTVDTACSSSLVSLDMAVQHLRSGSCSKALVGGVNVMLSSLNYVGSCAANMLSAQGRCSTFDASADGYCRGEGVGCIVLKPLQRAISDGDTILALVKGTAVNQDGRSATLTSPNGIAQRSVIQSALNSARISGKDINYVECHGTGTDLGDPIEVDALKSVLNSGRETPLLLGAVKTNIGHLEGAAGIASIIKTVLVLMHRQVPPNLHLKTVNPKIDLNNFNVMFPIKCMYFDELEPRKHDRLTSDTTGNTSTLFAGVSSFGFGGTNAHVILQSWNVPKGAEKKKTVVYEPKFFPWRRMTHPLVYRQIGDTSYGSQMTGERATIWDDHRINDRVLFPGTSHLTMMAGVVSELSANSIASAIMLQDVVMLRQLKVFEGMRVNCVVMKGKVEIRSDPNDTDSVYAYASESKNVGLNELPRFEVELVRKRCTRPVNVDSLYTQFHSLGAQFGPKFRTLLEVWVGENEALARIGLSNMTTWERSLRFVHPAILDGAFQLLGFCAIETTGLCVPFHMNRVILAQLHEQTEVWAHVHLKEKNATSLRGSVTLATSTGSVVAFVEDITSRPISDDWIVSDCLYETEWMAFNAGSSVHDAHRIASVSSIQVPSGTLSGEISIMNNSLGSRNESNAFESQLLAISFNDIQLATCKGRWVNAVSVKDMATFVIHDKNNNSNQPEGLNPISLEVILSSRKWNAIAFVADIDDMMRVMEKGLELLKFFEQDHSHGEEPPCIWFVTAARSYHSAGLWALARTARIELQHLRINCLQSVSNLSSDAVTTVLAAISELDNRIENEFRLLENGDILVSRIAKASVTDTNKRVCIRKSATYVLSGGLGALGQVLVGWLVDRGATHILILSRTAAAEIIEKLQLSQSCSIKWIQCDVSSRNDVEVASQALSDLAWPEVIGVFHVAGVLSDGTIGTSSTESMRNAYAPKVFGAINLHSFFRPSEFFFIFSSASGVFGSPGQASYSAANATVDAIAEYWSGAGEHVLSIQWGAWSEVGMALSKGAVDRVKRSGFGTLTNDTGMRILDLLCKTGKTGTVCAVPVNWNRMNSKSPFLSNYAIHKEITETNDDFELEPNTQEDILKIVRIIVKDILGSSVNDDTPLVDAGMDSLSAIELRNRLATGLKVRISSVFAFNYPSIKDMAVFLGAQAASTKQNSNVKTEIRHLIKREPIAVVGMSCRLPGHVSTTDEFWSMLINGRDGVSDIPQSRFDMSEVYDPIRGTAGKSYTRRGAFMDDVEWFDHSFFNISHTEALSMDPQQRLLLEVAYDALNRAGYDINSLKGSRTGVFVGQMNYDWMMLKGKNPSYGGTGTSPAISSNRLSYVLGLSGPSLTIDTACSSSLVALDIAIQQILNGKCSTAVVAGVNVMLQSVNFVGSSAANMLSAAGRCATFDASADGYCRGEGVGCVVIKTLSEAIANSDNILALVRGTAVNQDGRSASLTAPNGQAQTAVIRQALAEADLSGNIIDFVECHGTGTPLGDPIEIDALKDALNEGRTKPVILGSVKTNIGHLEGAAGIVGLIKTILVLQHGEVPPNLHFRTLNPKIDLSEFKCLIPSTITPLRPQATTYPLEQNAFYAGVSSFGFGGTNAHAILQSWPDSSIQGNSSRRLAYLFTGQGSQFSGMGRDLYLKDNTFKEALDLCSRYLETVMDIPLLSLLFDGSNKLHLDETRYSQPAILSVQYAKFKMLQARGILPQVVIGHSIGEYAAAVSSGVMNIRDALYLVAKRGQLMDTLCAPGAMAAVFENSTEVLARLPHDVVISAINSPTQTVISGTASAMQGALDNLNIPHRKLQVNHGFHSHLMTPMLQAFTQEFENITLTNPAQEITFISTVSGLPVRADLCTPKYWVDQVSQPVNFQAAMISASTSEVVDYYVEIGPKPLLIPIARKFIDLDSTRWIPNVDHETSVKLRSNLLPVMPTRIDFAYKRKFLPWRTAQETPITGVDHGPEQYLVADCLYETTWEDASLIVVEPVLGSMPNTPSDKARNLLLSFVPISTDSTNWVNIVNTQNHMQSTNGPNGHHRYADFRSSIKQLVCEEPWNAVVLISSADDNLLGVQIAVQLLQVVGSMNSTSSDIWFIVQSDEVQNTLQSDSCGSAMRALSKTARFEMNQLRVRCLTVPHSRSASDVARWMSTIMECCKTTEMDFTVTADDSLKVERLSRMSTKPSAADMHNYKVEPNATYIVSGGLGALGLVVASWLVKSGATHVALFSRSKTDTEPEELRDLRLKSRAEIVHVSCDVSSFAQVQKLKEHLSSIRWPPVLGVVHAAGALHDGMLQTMSLEQIAKTFESKRNGATNLRAVFKPVDFLILFSSAAAVFGSAGQANYAAANAAMDALAAKWWNKGEKVLSIQWGAWSDGGMALNKHALTKVKSQGFGLISNKLGTDILSALLKNQKFGVICATPINWSSVKLHTPLVANLNEKKQTDSDTRHIQESHNDVDIEAVLTKISYDVVGVEILKDVPLFDAGMDSLGAVEFRNQISESLRIQLPAGILFDFPTITSLAQYLKSQVRVRGTVSLSRPINDSMSVLPVLVVGAGLGGLSFANMLSRSGQKVVVMESQAEIGGVWQMWANNTSKLQIDAPSYDFGCIDPLEKNTASSIFPSKKDILLGAEKTSKSFEADVVQLNTRVVSALKISDSNYLVEYTNNGSLRQKHFSGVVAFTGGLHLPRTLTINGEKLFSGTLAQGIKDDVPVTTWKNSEVVIIGHGAYAVENMRTAFEYGASHVTILCKCRSLVVSSFCNWLLNSAEGNMPIRLVVDIMKPLYKAASVDILTLPCFSCENGEFYFDQNTVPPASDLYFLAQALGKLEVIEDEADHLTNDTVVTKLGRSIKADVVLKCIGFHADNTLLENIFGPSIRIDGLWINGDPNLLAYNDVHNISRKVRSLLCPSYLFFVQTYATVYMYYRRQPEELQDVLRRIQEVSPEEVNGRLMVQLWDFFAPAKKTVSERTRRLCPVRTFLNHREKEWNSFIKLLAPGSTHPELELWNFVQLALKEVGKREPLKLMEERNSFDTIRSSVYRPLSRRRVLFLHGQGTNASIASQLLEENGWIDQFKDQLEFIIPDAPREINAFTCIQQLEAIGLDSLIERHLYKTDEMYREWSADFDWFAEQHNTQRQLQVDGEKLNECQNRWNRTFGYIKNIAKQYGPFDGIAGFCEGASVAAVALHLQASFGGGIESAMDLGLGNVSFFIAIAPWRNPFYERKGMFSNEHPLDIASLHIAGLNDMDMFKNGAPIVRRDFKNAVHFEHSGKHVYPLVSPKLKAAIVELVERATNH